MEPLTIRFLDAFPDGLRQITTENWSGNCLMISRNRVEAALQGTGLTVSGVYILIGPSDVTASESSHTPVSKIYIGKGDSVDERLALHNKSKDFWSTAFVFCRSGLELNASQTWYLEAQLIEQTRTAGNHAVTNVATPRQPRMGDTEKASMNSFLAQIEFVLQALGHDLFSSPKLPAVALTEVKREPQIITPRNLQPLVEAIRQALVALPSTEFYETAVPDLRAKVVSTEGSRAFARIQFRKQGIRFSLLNQTPLTLPADGIVDQVLVTKIAEAHRSAQTLLTT